MLFFCLSSSQWNALTRCANSHGRDLKKGFCTQKFVYFLTVAPAHPFKKKKKKCAIPFPANLLFRQWNDGWLPCQDKLGMRLSPSAFCLSPWYLLCSFIRFPFPAFFTNFLSYPHYHTCEFHRCAEKTATKTMSWQGTPGVGAGEGTKMTGLEAVKTETSYGEERGRNQTSHGEGSQLTARQWLCSQLQEETMHFWKLPIEATAFFLQALLKSPVWNDEKQSIKTQLLFPLKRGAVSKCQASYLQAQLSHVLYANYSQWNAEEAAGFALF